MDDLKKNASGYYDPTAYKAIKNIDKIDYRKLWNQFRQWMANYKIEKIEQMGMTNSYKSTDTLHRYCIAISIDDLLQKMKEFEEQNNKNSGQIWSKKWAKSGQSGQKVGKELKNFKEKS